MQKPSLKTQKNRLIHQKFFSQIEVMLQVELKKQIIDCLKKQNRKFS